ncbi:MAG: MBL fold metallo-hydrolase [Chloroflexota bacterium]|nr:MBL fold metallo-hydrolase [Chloroflexota bacterium]
MQIKLGFYGAARNVTGSRFFVEFGGIKMLVDCGLYQERHYRERNWDPSPIPARTLDAVLLTHAHIDHCGLIPKLVKEGFRGRIYCTDATADIVRIMLLDAARLQEEDAAFKKKRHRREGRKGPYPEVPLYTVDDAKDSFPLLSPVRYGERVRVGGGIDAVFHDAGHVLGSSMLTVDFSDNGDTRRVLFSGDVGRHNRPILRDPSVFDEADYVLIESTYGDRLHDDSGRIGDELAEVINSTVEAGGNLVVPSFALERSQEILYFMNELLGEDRIPHILVFFDSPMALSITEVFERHPELFDKEALALIRKGDSPFEFPGLTKTRMVAESKAINRIKGSAMIIAGSGMCSGGRVKHHLASNISRPESTVLFVGYQAVGTLGRQIVDGAEEVRILGQKHPVRARVAQIQGFSAHADRDELFRWISALKNPPRGVFVVHGEEESSKKFAGFLTDNLGWNVSVPEYRDEVILD